MEVKILLALMGLACLLCKDSHCLRISPGNNIWQEDLDPIASVEEALEAGVYQGISTGPEKLSIEVFEIVKDGLEEETKKELPTPMVDEETIKKAEKAANKDLLNGLNRILKNNETLEDVFRAEKIYKIP